MGGGRAGPGSAEGQASVDPRPSEPYELREIMRDVLTGLIITCSQNQPGRSAANACGCSRSNASPAGDGFPGNSDPPPGEGVAAGRSTHGPRVAGEPARSKINNKRLTGRDPPGKALASSSSTNPCFLRSLRQGRSAGAAMITQRGAIPTTTPAQKSRPTYGGTSLLPAHMRDGPLPYHGLSRTYPINLLPRGPDRVNLHRG